MKLFFWKKDQVVTDGAYAPYEEIDAKRTSKLGYFFLILMVIFGVWQGNNFLRAIEDTITTPPRNSWCSAEIASYAHMQTFRSGSYDYSYSYEYDYSLRPSGTPQDCAFTDRERAVSLDGAYAKILPLKNQLTSLDTVLNNIQRDINSARMVRERTANDYQTSLVEDIAKTENGGVLDSNALGGGVMSQDQYIASKEAELAVRTAERQRLMVQIETSAKQYIGALTTVNDQYASEMRVYEFKQFALSFVLVIPLFYFAWRKYNKARLNRSEYTIIWGGIVATFGLIVAQVLLVFVYQILPHQIIQALLKFLASIKIIWTLLYWLGFILVPLFFGFLIYLIQKKFYNKRAVMMRALKSGHCPNCSLTINHTMNNCPVCGYELKSKCEACGAMSMSGGAFCESCGVRRNGVQPPVQ